MRLELTPRKITMLLDEKSYGYLTLQFSTRSSTTKLTSAIRKASVESRPSA